MAALPKLAVIVAVARALVAPQSSLVRRRPLDATATLGLGCFWEPSEKLLAVDGVRDTRGAASSARVGASPRFVRR